MLVHEVEETLLVGQPLGVVPVALLVEVEGLGVRVAGRAFGVDETGAERLLGTDAGFGGGLGGRGGGCLGGVFGVDETQELDCLVHGVYCNCTL